MAKEDYIDRVGLFEYNRLECLRNEYAKNECDECIKICPEGAFVFVRGKLRLEASLCKECGVCIGSCPSEALKIVADVFPVSELRNEKNPTLTCKEKKRCLARFRAFDYVSLVLESKKSFTCSLGECDGCELNHENKTLDFINHSIDEANRLLEQISSFKITKSLKFRPDPLEERRGFFRKLKGGTSSPLLHVKSLDRVKKSLKAVLEDEVVLEKDSTLFYHKRIDDSCTNCGECVDFCPTNALSYTKDKTKILFQFGKCIGCEICIDICKENSVNKVSKEVNLVDFAYDRVEVLAEHDLRICSVCKCSFSYKGGDLICKRCESFEKEYSEMFKLASDIV